jgi:hypothetical protein
MASSPQGLGETKGGEFLLKPETHPLPNNRKEIVARIETLLSAGGVQRLIIEVGQPIKLYRLVPKDETLVSPPETAADDLWGRLHNGPIEEETTAVLAPDYGNGYAALYFAFQRAEQRGMRPVVLFVASFQAVRQWLRMEKTSDVRRIFGMDIQPQADLPNDAAVLAAVSYDELNTDVYGVRVAMDLPKNGVKHE